MVVHDKFWKIILFLIGILLFLGGLGVELFYIKVYGVLISLLLVGLAWFWKGKIELPKTSKLYGVFLIFFLISLIWSKDWKFSFEHFLLFLSGGLFWLAFYNLSYEFGRWLDKIVIILGVIFGGLFIINHYWGEIQVRAWSLFLPHVSNLNHNNIGDFWSITLIVIIYYLLKKPKSPLYWPFVGLGIYFLFMGQSRSSYVALAVGVLYLFRGYGLAQKYRNILAGFVILTAVLFVFTGAFKTTLFVRPYYVQALVGLVHNPLGVGVGNFGFISTDPENWIFGLSQPAQVVSNIVLEIISGMGILGIVFAFWFFKVVFEVWRIRDLKSLVYPAIFLALSANFFFHVTYFVPTTLWLWFISLGIVQGKEV